jgi:LPXTG-site transpeptidase (sortase) family protein
VSRIGRSTSLGFVLLALPAIALPGSTSTMEAVTLDLSAERAAEVRQALARDPLPHPGDGVIGSIEIARVGVRGEILSGVDDVTIRRAVGHFPASSLPFQGGNMALAAHRTTHFSGLRDIRVGDAVTIRTDAGELDYVVAETWVVDPEDVWVLEPTIEPALTLVTCYPFDYKGTAPQRFIVRARAARP